MVSPIQKIRGSKRLIYEGALSHLTIFIIVDGPPGFLSVATSGISTFIEREAASGVLLVLPRQSVKGLNLAAPGWL